MINDSRIFQAISKILMSIMSTMLGLWGYKVIKMSFAFTEFRIQQMDSKTTDSYNAG